MSNVVFIIVLGHGFFGRDLSSLLMCFCMFYDVQCLFKEAFESNIDKESA